jgi:arabinonate dehydratase
MLDLILIHPTDSVCVATRDLLAGATVELLGTRVQLLDDVMQGHKIARTAIQSGEEILKWGQTIGFATCPIELGRWVHSQNMATGALRREYEKSIAVPDAQLTGDDPPSSTDACAGRFKTRRCCSFLE